MTAEEAFTSTDQQREMLLGIRSFKFQYLHILIMLLRDDSNQSALRIASAREALSILPDMVSNWGSVYNGVVWYASDIMFVVALTLIASCARQLLYLPFGPFFVMFGHILSDPAAWTVEQDLQLLRTTVAYFESMCSQLSLLSTLSSRLAHTASVFLQLAQHHVNAGAPKTVANTQSLDGFADIDLATIESYLAWLPAEFTESLPPTERIARPETTAGGHQDLAASRGLEGRFDDAFDWFSWDTYYANAHA